MQIIFLSGTKFLCLPHYVNTFLVWCKKIGPAQNILGPVIGQGIRGYCHNIYIVIQVVYTDTPESLHVAAAMNVKHHLTKLVKEGKVQRDGDNYFLQSGWKEAKTSKNANSEATLCYIMQIIVKEGKMQREVEDFLYDMFRQK